MDPSFPVNERLNRTGLGHACNDGLTFKLGFPQLDADVVTHTFPG
jgi:hypothetical protein